MPMRPQLTTYTCPACRWSRTVAPRSDALLPGEYFAHCPACGYESLEHRSGTPSPHGLLSAVLSRMISRK